MRATVVAAACLGLAGITGAASAEAAAAPTADGAAPRLAAEPTALEEVVVSARHRDETVLDVPMSITAINSDALERQNIQSFGDYILKVPNLTASYGAALFGLDATRATVIRGVVGANTTSYYIDDTPVPSTISPEVLDLERLEVLKGPQGTLYGASSMGGNLRFITKQPSLTTPDYRVRLQTGFTDGGGSPDYGVAGTGNFILVPDAVGLRASVLYTHDSGFTRRTYLDSSGNNVIVGDQGQPSVIGASLALKTQFSERFSVNWMAMGQLQDTQGLPVAFAPLPAFKINSYTTDHVNNLEQYSKNHWGIAAVSLKYQAPLWTITSSSSYFIGDDTLQEDGSEATTQFVEAIAGVDLHNTPAVWSNFERDIQYTHETRYSFDKGLLAPWISGVAGVYAQRSSQQVISAGANKQPLYVSGVEAAGLYPSDLFWDTLFGNHTWNSAVFGEVYVEPLERLQVTLGLRKYWINQVGDTTSSSGFSSFESVVPGQRLKQSGLIPKAVVAYKITPDMNAYASYSQGFRIGGSQPPLPSFCASDLAQLGLTPQGASRYGSDQLKSYELGFKARIGPVNTEVAAFDMEWSGIQQTIALNCGFAFGGNAGHARIRGAEWAADGRPLPGVPLTVQVGLGYLNPVLTDPAFLPQAAGTQLYLVPDWTATASGYYVQPLSAKIDGFLGVDYSYTDAVRTANVIATQPQSRQPIDMVSARMGITFGNSQLSLNGSNLLNEHYNFGDVRSLAFELSDSNGTRIPRVVAARPMQVSLQYVWRR